MSRQTRGPTTPRARIPGIALGIALALTACGGADRGEYALAAGEPVDVLLVTLDTTRADRLGCYGHAAARTPVVDALAARGARFTAAHSPCPLTLPSHATLLTGTFPPEHGLRDNGRAALGAGVPHLAELFAARGWRTGAIIGAAVLDAAFGLDRGFADYDDAMGPEGALMRDARAVTDAALAWLARGDERPWLLWAHYYDPHAAYEPPPPFDALPDLYDGEIAYVDAELGRLLAALEARGTLERTLVVVTSDHGEALGEHGERTHGVTIYQATQRVPLVVTLPPGAAPPSMKTPRVVDDPVRLADLLPTLAELLDWSVPPGVSGTSFAPALAGAPIAPRPVYAESEYARLNFGWSALRALRVGDWKLVRSPHPELYDLARDPHETTDRFAAEPARAAELGAALDAFEARLVRRDTAAAAADPDLLARITALGYAAGGTGGTGDDPYAGRDPAREIELLNRYHEVAGRVKRGEAAAALPELRELALAMPEAAQVRALCGMALAAAGDAAEARAELEAALAAEPRYAPAHHQLGMLLLGAGERDTALEHLELAAELDPSNQPARLEAARLRVARQEHERALAHYDVLVARAPDDGELRLQRAYLLRWLGRHPEMVAEVSELVRRDPDDAANAAYLAWELATNPDPRARDGQRALELARGLVEAARARGAPDPDLLDTLAAALAETGDFAAARRTAERALALAGRSGRGDLAAQIERRLAHYRRAEPFRAE